MTPFKIFKLCQGMIGRKYRGDLDSFRMLQCSNYYYSLADFLKDKFGKNSLKHSQYIKICSSSLGTRFDPFKLMTDEYVSVFEEWERINGDDESYKKNIKKSIQKIYDFCRDRDIDSIQDYVNRWSVSHIVSGMLEDNVAYILGVHDLHLTKPEKKLIKKKYLDKVPDIKDRMERDEEIKDFILKNIQLIKEKIGRL